MAREKFHLECFAIEHSVHLCGPSLSYVGQTGDWSAHRALRILFGHKLESLTVSKVIHLGTLPA